MSATINLLLNGATLREDRNKPFSKTAVNKPKGKKKADPGSLGKLVNARNTYHFLASGQASLPMDSMGNPWTGNFVTTTDNLKLDLLHNFFLECGARGNKTRVYEICPDPTAPAMVGYLLVLGGVHIVAYAKALEKLTEANVGHLLHIPDVSNK